MTRGSPIEKESSWKEMQTDSFEMWSPYIPVVLFKPLLKLGSSLRIDGFSTSPSSFLCPARKFALHISEISQRGNWKQTACGPIITHCLTVSPLLNRGVAGVASFESRMATTWPSAATGRGHAKLDPEAMRSPGLILGATAWFISWKIVMQWMICYPRSRTPP